MFLKLSLFVTGLGVFGYYYLLDKSKSYIGDRLFDVEELSKYDGVKSESLYLSILGKVYDVTEGRQHYGPDSSYNVFIGRDASKSFITGEFSSTDSDLSDVLALSRSELSGLEYWMNMYEGRYKYEGKLIGRFYDKYGAETDYLRTVFREFEAIREDKAREDEAHRLMPSCNVEWNADTGSRVWCTNRSGGVHRNWIGVPRLLYRPGSSEPRCVCVHNDRLADPNLKPYDGCSHTSDTCYVKDSK